MTEVVEVDWSVVDDFNRLYYGSAATTWDHTFWRGFKMWKLPTDLFILQEIIYELRPDLIIETGTAYGGSAIFMADILDLIWGVTPPPPAEPRHRIISIDISPMATPKHPRIQYIVGSSTADSVIEIVRRQAAEAKTVLVVLDSDHRKEHVYHELRLYSPLVTKGSYVIVEDTNVNGHPSMPEFGPGPWEAVSQFLAAQIGSGFEPDTFRERFLLTTNPRGYLKRVT